MLNKGWCLCSGRLQKRCENAPGQKGKVTKVRILYHLTWCCIALISDTDKLYLRWSDIQLRATFFLFPAKQQNKGPTPVKAAVWEGMSIFLFYNIFIGFAILYIWFLLFVFKWNDAASEMFRTKNNHRISQKRAPKTLPEVILYPINIGSVRFIIKFKLNI